MKLIHELIEAYAAAFPSRAAVIDSQGELSYQELEARSAFFARGLVSMGLRPGREVWVGPVSSISFRAISSSTSMETLVALRSM